MDETRQWEYDDGEFDNRVTNLAWTICGDYSTRMDQKRK